MQTTLTLDDSLLTQASAIAGIQQPGALIHFALRALVERAPRKTITSAKPSLPFVITGPLAEGNPDVCRNRMASELLAELDDEAYLEIQARNAP